MKKILFAALALATTACAEPALLEYDARMERLVELEPTDVTMREPVEVIVPATVAQTATRGTAVQITETVPPPSLVPDRALWGTAGSDVAGRCTQFEPLIAALGPDWSVERMSGYAHRESMCCPQLLYGDGIWRTTQGGDRFDERCNFSHVAVWHHRSDAGLFQINGINYNPARCGSNCASRHLGIPVNLETLGDPTVNVLMAGVLCETASSCYQPWRR